MTRHFYAALLVVLVGVVLAPLLLHPEYLLYPRDGQATDLTITHWPAVAFNVRSLRQDGQIPLWRTTIASGGPWAANPQSWLYYPPAWLFYLLPINLTFNLLQVSHLLLVGLGTYAFGRRALGLEPPGAALAGLAFALSPWLSGQLSAGHVNVVLAMTWLPVALLGAHRAVTSGSARGALLAGIAWAAALLNHVQMAFFVAALTVAWFLGFTLKTGGAVGRRRQLGLLLSVPALALLLSAPLLVPLAEALPHLNRIALTVDEAGAFSLPWSALLTTLVPTYGGEPEYVIYLGLPVALLAILGLALKRDWLNWLLALIIALATLFALGTHAPLFPLLIRWLPGLGWLRVPPRAWVLVTFGVALLAGRGLDTLTHRQLSPTLRRRVNLIGLGALATGLALAVGLLFLYRSAPAAAWAMAALTVLAVGVLMLRTHAWLRPRSFVIIMLLLVAADLGLVSTAWTEMRAPADAFAWHAETAEYLARQSGQFRTYSPSYSLPQHVALQHDLYLADGVDPIQLAHYAEFLASAGGYGQSGYSPTLPPTLDDTSAQPDAARLGMLNVGYVVAGFPLKAEGLTLEEQLNSTYLYRNERILPRAFSIPHATPPPGRDVSLEIPIEPRSAHVAAYAPNRILVELNLDIPGLLVLSELWYPGWRAMADGQEIPILRVEGILRGVYLERGSHTVEFRYAPWTAWAGLVISGGTALALLTYAAYGAWRRA